MIDQDWMKFEQSGSVADYLEYRKKSERDAGQSKEADGAWSRKECTDGAADYSDRHGAYFHARRGI